MGTPLGSHPCFIAKSHRSFTIRSLSSSHGMNRTADLKHNETFLRVYIVTQVHPAFDIGRHVSTLVRYDVKGPRNASKRNIECVLSPTRTRTRSSACNEGEMAFTGQSWLRIWNCIAWDDEALVPKLKKSPPIARVVVQEIRAGEQDHPFGNHVALDLTSSSASCRTPRPGRDSYEASPWHRLEHQVNCRCPWLGRRCGLTTRRSFFCVSFCALQFAARGSMRPFGWLQ